LVRTSPLIIYENVILMISSYTKSLNALLLLITSDPRLIAVAERSAAESVAENVKVTELNRERELKRERERVEEIIVYYSVEREREREGFILL